MHHDNTDHMERRVYWDILENPVIKRIWNQTIIMAFLLLVIFNNILLSKLIEICAFGLLALYILQYVNIYRRKLLLFIEIIIAIIIIIIPVNFFYLRIDQCTLCYSWFNPYMLDPQFWYKDLMAGYGLLTLLSVAAMVMMILYYKSKKRQLTRIGSDSENDVVTNMFDAFLTGSQKGKKFITLALLLISASLVEEITYRWLIINGLTVIDIPFISHPIVIIIVSSIAFGWAHEANGFILYVFNSSLAGVIFALFYMSYGLLPVWILHLLWNTLIVIERKIELKLNGVD